MEDLSDLELNFDSDLNCLEDLYSTMESCLPDEDPLTPPASTLSMASWAFSPISAHEENASPAMSADKSLSDCVLVVSTEKKTVDREHASVAISGESEDVFPVSAVNGVEQKNAPDQPGGQLSGINHHHQQQQQHHIQQQHQQQQCQQQHQKQQHPVIVDQSQPHFDQQQEQLKHHMQFLRQQQQLIQLRHQQQQQQCQFSSSTVSRPSITSSTGAATKIGLSSSAVAVAAPEAISRPSATISNIHSEYYQPQNISYQQHVNIHNYMGNYSFGIPVWRDTYPWHNPANVPQIPAPAAPFVDHGEMLVSLSNNTVSEIKRCSTPDYLLTLKTLSQLDSPVRSTNTPPSQSSCVYGGNSSSQDNSTSQDSGYSSDLNVSPLIEYQDNRPVRYPRLCDSKQTSTPASKQVQHCVNQDISSVVEEAKNQAVSNLSNLVHKTTKVDTHDSVINKTENSSSTPSIQKNLINDLRMYSQSDSETYRTVEDYYTAKKEQKCTKSVSIKATGPSKRKHSDCDKENDASSKRRRHNQPLNDAATRVMVEWYEQNLDNPYPSRAEKEKLARDGGITVTQVKSWFANKRNRSNNTRPKKQMKQMEGKLLELCHELARDAYKPQKDNAYYIQQLSGILGQAKY